MARVKMNAKHEYEFIANFKILQNVFRSHKVEKVRPPPTPNASFFLFLLAYTCRETREVQDAVCGLCPRVTYPLAHDCFQSAGITSSSFNGPSASGTPTTVARATTPSHGDVACPPTHPLPLHLSPRAAEAAATCTQEALERAAARLSLATARDRRNQTRLSRISRRS